MQLQKLKQKKDGPPGKSRPCSAADPPLSQRSVFADGGGHRGPMQLQELKHKKRWPPWEEPTLQCS
jgi:hypothetical protein